MRKNLLTVAALAVAVAANAQFLSYVGDGAQMTIQADALVYNGGGMQIVGSGKIDNSGNVMLVGDKTGTPAQFKTLTTTGAPKTDGGNFILRLNDPTNYNTSHYGQFYIENLLQGDITGIVDKEYRATKNGSMQQMALPFYGKSFSSLAQNLGFTAFSNTRNTSAVGYWENERPVMHNIPGSQSTLDKASADIQTVKNNNAARYYAVGTASWNPETPSNGTVYTVKGVPFSDNYGSQSTPTNLSYTLRGAGYINNAGTYTPINYGEGTGTVNNRIYNELYKTYLQDAFDNSGQGFFKGTFGRNLYQFGNPFLTNIDLTRLGYDEDGAGTGDDGNNISNIQGIRYESIGVISNSSGTHATQYRYVMYNTDGTPVADYEGAVVKPMQAFVVKLRNNDSNQQLVFNKLRRFAYTPKAATISSTVTAARTTQKGSTNTVKQLRVIGLDEAGNEVMRTYYVVGQDFNSGQSQDVKVQATTSVTSALHTKEELPNGDVDTNIAYRLYVNEANESDYSGKPITLVTDLSKISSYQFQLAESAEALNNNSSDFSNGGSFYIENAAGQKIKISHNQLLPAISTDIKLYYEKAGVLSTGEVTKNSKLVIAKSAGSETYLAIFPKNWKKATVEIYDISGKLVSKRADVSTISNYMIPALSTGLYILRATSESGEVANGKFLINTK